MKLLFSLLLLCLLAHARSQCASATYSLTITNLFTSANFPLAPSSAHLSPWTAFSHQRRFSSFVLYGYATPGVKDVAETGDNTRLLKELRNPLVSDISTSEAVFEGDPPINVDINLDCDNHFVSAISMIAPSPDWIIAIASLDMLGPDGKFVPKREGELRVYDAGTDAGATLTAADKVSDPVQNIAPLQGAPFDGKPAATYVLKLKGGGKGKTAGMMMRPKNMKGGGGKCPSAKYRLSVKNLWMKPRFKAVPTGAMLSPLIAASHSRRFSALTLYGYASPGVQAIAEAGDNSVLKEELSAVEARPFVKDVAEAAGPTLAGGRTTVELDVDCTFSVVTFLQMVAPSPDWIVGEANLQTFVKGKFVDKVSGALRVYDAGTDSGRTLLAKDKATTPRQNIAPLLGMPFDGRAIARFTLRKV